jgi:hypothetical protein
MPLVLFAALAIASALLLRFKPAPPPPAEEAAGSIGPGWTAPPREGMPAVQLEIDFGNGASRQFKSLPWQEGLTVAAAMAAASEHRPGIRTTYQGQGAMALLTSIDGVANQGAGGRSWIYQVNGRLGQVSYAVQPLSAGDRVLWLFSPAE